MYFSFPALASLVLLQVSTLPHSIVGALELHRVGQDSFENATTGNNKVRRMKKSKKSQNHHDHQSKKSKKKSSTVIDEMFTVMEQPESTVDKCK